MAIDMGILGRERLLVVFLNVFDGFKTYIAAAGLTALGLYQLSIGLVPEGLQSLFSALAAAGLRHAIFGLRS